MKEIDNVRKNGIYLGIILAVIGFVLFVDGCHLDSALMGGDSCIDVRVIKENNQVVCDLDGDLSKCDGSMVSLMQGGLCPLEYPMCVKKDGEQIYCAKKCESSDKIRCRGVCTGVTDGVGHDCQCLDGHLDCNDDYVDGCEVNQMVMHRTLCGTCQDGFADCNGNESDGCEVNLYTSHLESCNDKESTGLNCMEGYADCDGDKANGCEIKLSVYNLKSCEECLDGFSDCNDNMEKDGCEVNLVAMNMETCGTCKTSFSDCDGEELNGCETNLEQLNLKECGQCLDDHYDCNEDMKDGCEMSLELYHMSACGQCLDGYTDCNDNLEKDGCETQMEQFHMSACGQCLEGYTDCNGNMESDGCESNLNQDVDNCGECGNKCEMDEDKNVELMYCAAQKCRIGECKEGFADCNKDMSDGCEKKTEGICGDACVSEKRCYDWETCVEGVCRAEPIVSGCADGSREGFVDVSGWPTIAGCAGAWLIPGLHHNSGPTCERKAGNDAVDIYGRAGVNCNVEDLCSEGWHVCLGRADVLYQTKTVSNTDNGCTHVLDGLPMEPAFFLSRSGSISQGRCIPESAGLDEYADDLYGCGTIGSKSDGSCGVLNSHSGPNCEGLRKFGDSCCRLVDEGEKVYEKYITETDKLEVENGSEVIIEQNNNKIVVVEGLEDGRRITCGKRSYGSMRCSNTFFRGIIHSLNYYELVSGKKYDNYWDCTGMGKNEGNQITKIYDTQGGVLCCKDQCETDDDCTTERSKCFHHTCKFPCTKDAECKDKIGAEKDGYGDRPYTCLEGACTE